MSDKSEADKAFDNPHFGHDEFEVNPETGSVNGQMQTYPPQRFIMGGMPDADYAPRMNPADVPDAGGDDIAPDFVEEDVGEIPEGDRLARIEKLVAMLADAQREVGRVEVDLEFKSKIERKLREETIPNAMKEVRMKELTLTDGVKLTIEDDFKCTISEDHKPLALKWLREHSLGGIIKRFVGVAFGKGDDETAQMLHRAIERRGFPVEDDEAVHWQTLHATLKEERAKGTAIPQDLFGLFEYQTTTLKFPRGVAPPPKPKFKKKS